MLNRTLMVVVLACVFGSTGLAQTIYEPVVSQYRVGNQTFYYGGSQPRVLAYALRAATQADRDVSAIGRPGEGYLRRGLIGQPSQVTYRDDLPRQNAVVYGYTSTDARNDAYAAIPRFFRMRDLAASAVPAADGVGVVVPPLAPGTIQILPGRKIAPTAQPSTRPATQPKPVFVIPKSMLEPV